MALPVQHPKLRALVAAGLVALSAAPVHAACTASATPLQFGAIEVLPGGNSRPSTTAAIFLTCAGLAGTIGYSIAIGPSSGHADARVRYMRNALGGATLPYNLYLDPAHTQIWGEASSGSVRSGSLSSAGLLPATANLPVYGRISGGQGGLRAGAFNDVLLVTVTYAP